MRSPRPAWLWLLDKEWRELRASLAFWAMLLLTGPLVGVSFIGAVTAYGELSGLHGTSEGVGEAFSPLVGVWAPTFSAYELAAAFLLPFVVIRVVSGDRQSGAARLEQQQPLSAFARMAAKVTVLLAGWLIASLGAVLALALWVGYGGRLHAPELGVIVIGHLLNAGLTLSLAAAAAATTEHPATAAIVTLGATVGTWVVNIVAAVRGGFWERLAEFTPPAMVAGFQHGLLRADVVLIAATLTLTGLAVAAIATRSGVPARQRGVESLAVVGVAALVIFAASLVRLSVDASEDRYNSFAAADETALSRIRKPLRIEVHLAPEDPRRRDLERHALSKLRRTLADVRVRYVSATSVGLFEQTSDHYGEIGYDLGGRRAINRLTSADGVLETIYTLAGEPRPEPDAAAVFRGHPLAVAPRGAGVVFYALWPAAVLASATLVLRRGRRV